MKPSTINLIILENEQQGTIRPLKRHFAWMKPISILSFIFCSFFYLNGFGQRGITYDLQKPQKYENRKLGYEKTEETKFKVPRHFIQNTVTHYNYYFNANNKLNEILARAKSQNRDDYTQLLPFYNYSLEATARDKRDLDSVIDKCNTAILIHDLRNDWVDNLYILMGKSYYFRNDVDSAYITFQFVNYAFSPRDKDGFDKPIGSNANSDDGGNAFIVSTNEKRNIIKKAFSLPPSRNEALVWQVRTFIARDLLSQAAALIDILQHDPQFPPRLQSDLQEVQAWWFYKQRMYDSAAFHLEKALGNANGALEQARWEFLIAQLYERAGKPEMALDFYERVTRHTYDPVMDVFARLGAIRQNKGKDTGEDYIEKNIEALKRMARKDIYADYRDLIYYTAAEMELERKNKSAAIGFLLRSVDNSAPGSPRRNKAFLKLGDLAFDDKKYKTAKSYYDSLNMNDTTGIENIVAFTDRKKALDSIVVQLNIIERQDSLQRIAALPQNERAAYIKKLARTLRKQQGLHEEEGEQGGSQNIPISNNNNNAAAADLFNSNTNTEWYFNNNSLKAKGYNDFKSKWGNRKNVDNWFLASLSSRQTAAANNPALRPIGNDEEPHPDTLKEVTTESLLNNLPLTPEKMQKSKDSVEHALFALGKSYQDGLPDYISAIGTYDTLLEQFPSTGHREEALSGLYYCYKKLGDEANAARILQLLGQNYPSGKYYHAITNPGDSTNAIRKAATSQYEHIYNDFIEGNFDQAVAEKKKADSLYGDQYWTPQLLYIEAVYLIHQRQDSAALAVLNRFLAKYQSTPMSAKVKNLMDVLKRRRQIEDYLTNLKIERAKDDDSVVVTPAPPPPVATSVPVQGKIETRERTRDSVQTSKLKPIADSAIVKKAPDIRSAFAYDPNQPHAVAVLLSKVDPVYVTETRNALNRYNREYFYSKTLDIAPPLALDDTNKLVIVRNFENAAAALDYMEKTQKLAPREIIPWLAPAKYSFLIITDQNLEILKNNKDLNGYKKFLSGYYPGKF